MLIKLHRLENNTLVLTYFHHDDPPYWILYRCNCPDVSQAVCAGLYSANVEGNNISLAAYPSGLVFAGTIVEQRRIEYAEYIEAIEQFTVRE